MSQQEWHRELERSQSSALGARDGGGPRSARVLGVSRQVIHRRYVSGTPKKKPVKKATKAQKATQ